MESNENNITSLRGLLFDTMRQIKDGKIDVDKAKTISEIGQVIINSAKVEVDHLRVIGGSGSGFIPSASLPNPNGNQSTCRTSKGNMVDFPAPGVTVHKMVG